MAGRGYLGKISAILTADSKGLSRGLNAGAKDVTQFARKIQSTISGATSRAGREFDNILTPLQKLQRALKVGVGQNLKLVNQQEVQAIRQFAEAAERIAKPVSQAAKDFAGLSTQVQRNFAPALESAQKAAEQLRTSIGNGARVSERDFANLEARINRVTQAASRLREAGQATAGLATGQELRFQRPGFLQQTSRAAALQQQAAALSPEQIRGSGVAALVGQQRQAAREAENLLSTLERIRVTRNGDAQAAEAAYNRQVAGLRAINDQLEQEITLSRQAAAAAQQLAEAQNRFSDAERDRRSGASARRNANAFEDATAGLTTRQQPSASGFGPVVRTMESELARARAVQEQFRALPAETQRQLEDQKARFDSVSNAAAAGAAGIGTFTNAIDRLEQSVRDANSELGRLDEATAAARADAQRRAEAASRFLNVDQRESNLISNQGAVSRVNPQQQFLGRVGGEIAAVRNQLRELPGVAAELGPAVDNLTTRWQNLARAGVGVTAEQLQRVRKETQDVQAALNSRREIASGFSSQFGGAGAAGIGVGIDERKLRAIGSEFEFLQGKIAGVTGGVRGPLVAAMERYRAVSTRAFREGTISTTQGQRAIARARDEVVRLAAALLNVKPGRLAEQLKRVGDVARGSFGNASLAIQQAAFAVDDFFSVTGGLDQRIRAIGNNISQLGFLVGGTAGLIAGIGVSIGSQLVASLIKWYTAGNTVEDQQKRLKDRLDAVNASIERQKSLTEQLASAYKSLGESIASIGLSEQGRTFQGRRRQIAGIQESQRQRRVEIVEQTDAGIARRRERIASLEQRLETEPREAVRARLRETIRAIEKTIEARLKQFEADADILINRATVTARRFRTTPEAELRARRGQVQGELESARRVVDTLGADNAPRWVEKIDKLSGELAALEVALQKLTDAVGTDASRSAFRVADQLGRSQERLSEIPGFTNVEQAANQLSTKLESLVASLGEADSRELAASILKQIEALQKQAAAVERTSIALESFSAALERAAGNLARTVESELASTAESLRRRANAAEAEFGRNDPRTIEARRDAGQIEAARRRATENRQQIEAELSAQRQKFEADAAAGVGNREAAEISERLRQLSEIQSSETASASQKEAARLESDRLQTRLNEIFNELPKVQELRRRADLGDVEAQRQIQDIESRARGRELAKTPAQRAAEQAAKDATDLQAEFERRAARNPFEAEPRDPAEIERERVAAFNRLAEQQAQQVAPMLAGFREERMDAILQGPSRAALNVADAQTMEGNRELNRLLRGDDPNKDVNLVELQKQSDLLQGVIDAINNQAGQDVVEIRG